MRYREGNIPENIGPHITNESLVFTAVLGLLMGIGFVVAGIRARQIWLAVWGGGLVISSILYIGYVLLF